jgi:hypothetical protein
MEQIVVGVLCVFGFMIFALILGLRAGAAESAEQDTPKPDPG